MYKFNYFYRIENKITKQFYYGVHKTSNLDDGYMGSGIRIKRAIKKYKKENFIKEILVYFNTYKDALNYETEIVTEELTMDINCYNLKCGGSGGWAYVNINNLNKTDNWKNACKKTGKLLGDTFGGANKFSNEQIKNRLELIKHIDMSKFGWVNKVSKILNISHTQTRRFIEKYYNGKYYRKKSHK